MNAMSLSSRAAVSLKRVPRQTNTIVKAACVHVGQGRGAGWLYRHTLEEGWVCPVVLGRSTYRLYFPSLNYSGLFPCAFCDLFKFIVG